ncbi:MAG: hypothetical protein OXE52_03515 [Chloroflexi bacterium]|nr:hypothetical protein [Chloroflexota bacterium]
MGVGIRDNSNTLHEFSGSGSETKSSFPLSAGKWEIKITVSGAAKVQVFDTTHSRVLQDFHKNVATSGTGFHILRRFHVQVACSVNVIVNTSDLSWQGHLKKL